MKRRYDDMDEWLRDRIDEDLTAMADEREKFLMESEALQDIEMPMERLQDIHREIEARKHKTGMVRIRRRMIIAAAAAMSTFAVWGMVGTGNRLYKPVIMERQVGEDEFTIKVNNTEDYKESEYDEEEICQEIEEKLGVLPVRLAYQPEGMFVSEYWIKESEESVFVNYKIDEKNIYVYISKNYKGSNINKQPDGAKTDTIEIISNGLKVDVLEYRNNEGEVYYTTSFEYLDTYYSFNGMIEKEEFIKILENIAIKNA